MNSTLEFAYLTGGFAGLFIGAVITILFCRYRNKANLASVKRFDEMERSALQEKWASTQHLLDSAQIELQESRSQLDRCRRSLTELEAAKAALVQQTLRIPQLEKELYDQRKTLKQSDSVNLDLEKELAACSTQLAAERKQTEEKISLLNDARERMANEFRVLGQKILEENSKLFADRSQNQIEGLIHPLRDQLVDFKSRVEDVYDKGSRDRAALRSEIGQLKHLNERIGKDALNLTQALKGDVKMMGGWGEVILERILEASGLEKGREYDTQISLYGNRGKRYQPDVIVRLPEARDVIIDAKVSLTAYERYHSATDERRRSSAIKEHLASVRSHIKGLNRKQYENLQGIRTLDFVLMFIPIEAAFLVTLEHDRSIFSDAFGKNIVVVSPSTLMVTLRTIQNIWRNVAQNENALEIARQAGGLYDKFVGFLESLEEIGRQLDRAKEAYRTARERLATGRGNLVRRTEQLISLGVKAGKMLPESYVRDLEEKESGCSEKQKE